MSLLKLKDRVNFLRIYLTPALEEGLISMKYPKNPKHPGQKYMLTEKGKALLKQKDDKGSDDLFHCLCRFYFCIKCFKLLELGALSVRGVFMAKTVQETEMPV